MDGFQDWARSLLGTSYFLLVIAFYVLYVIALWRVFNKAGYPGILALIPIVNVFFTVKIAGYSAWMTLLLVIPIVNIIFIVVLAVRIGGAFGKDGLWSFFLLLVLPIIGVFILGYGPARYRRPA